MPKKRSVNVPVPANVPVSENLAKLLRQAIAQYGSQKHAAEALNIGESTFSRLMDGRIRFPSTDTLVDLAKYKSATDGRPWTTRQLMAWLWELPNDKLPPEPSEIAQIRTLLEDGIALLESGIVTLASTDSKLQAMSNQASQDEDLMCSSLVQVLQGVLRQSGLDLNKERDYKKLCKMLDGAPDDQGLLRLRQVVLGQETAVSGDRMAIARALKALGDTTPAYELALNCQNC